MNWFDCNTWCFWYKACKIHLKQMSLISLTHVWMWNTVRNNMCYSLSFFKQTFNMVNPNQLTVEMFTLIERFLLACYCRLLGNSKSTIITIFKFSQRMFSIHLSCNSRSEIWTTTTSYPNHTLLCHSENFPTLTNISNDFSLRQHL